MKHKNGFTLIELLVVIAIIGILSAVVLASLSTARMKGDDAGVKANLDSVKTQAAVYLSANSQGYGTFDNGTAGTPSTCPTPGTAGSTVFHDTTIESAVAAALKDAGGTGGKTYCVANGTGYAVAVSRADTNYSTYWCVDSAGDSCGINSAVLSGVSCGTCDSRL